MPHSSNNNKNSFLIKRQVYPTVLGVDLLEDEPLSMFAHDLRTPLSAAKSYAELMTLHSKNSETQKYLATKIVETLDRMDSLILDLLDSYRIQAGESFPLTIEHCDLISILDIIFKELSIIHGSRFVLDASEPITGYWSECGLRRIIQNLCDNAAKYGEPQTPITTSLRKNNEWVQISVHNHGNPISQEDLAHLFRPFHRTKVAQIGGKKGWGIGLMLVSRMTRALGGNVEVRSSVAEGTTFTVNIPRNVSPPHK